MVMMLHMEHLKKLVSACVTATVCLTQGDVSPLHRVGQVIDRGLWNIEVMLCGPTVVEPDTSEQFKSF